MYKLSHVHARGAAIVLFTALSAVFLLVFSKQAAEGVSDGLFSSAQLLVPSLFPFMLLSSFIIRSGAADIIGRALSFFTTRVFRLPGEAAAAVILSFIGGFPVGASCVKTLYDRKNLTASQAEQMMMFCVCSGPAFLITGVGVLLLHNPGAGVLLYVSPLISGLVLGFIAGRIYGKKAPAVQTVTDKYELPKQSLSDAFVLSCGDASRSILGLTAMVAAFSMLISVFEGAGITGALTELLKLCGADSVIADKLFLIIAEVTGACREISQSGCPLWLLSAAVGFGGLCVHFQIFSILGDIKIRKSRFFLFRAGNALLSSVIVYIVCRSRPQTAEVFAPSGEIRGELSSVSAFGAAVLVLMSAVFVLSLKNTQGTALTKRR